jgi:hypothetical protein
MPQKGFGEAVSIVLWGSFEVLRNLAWPTAFGSSVFKAGMNAGNIPGCGEAFPADG